MRRKFYSMLFGTFLYLLLPFALAAQNQTPWEQVKASKGTYAFHITQNGTWLLSDYLFDQTGGIYVSKDEGTTWEKAEISDYNYNRFYEVGGYVFALGAAGRIARSADGGSTWEMLNYQRAMQGVSDEKGWDYTQCYAIEYHNERLYIGDFSGGGVMYSEDFGETWHQTDHSSLSYEIDDGGKGISTVTESIYNLASYNGNLYCFGVYFVFRYNEADHTWEMLRNDSNFMTRSVIHQGRLCCVRSTMNYDFGTPFIETIEPDGSWGEVQRPSGLDDNNIRAIGSDGQCLYVGLQNGGFYYTPDGGENWADLNNGLPVDGEMGGKTYYLAPMNIVTTDDYVYVAYYQMPFAQGDGSGVWRIPKASLPYATGIEQATHDGGIPVVSADGSALRFGEGTTGIQVFDLGGRRSRVAVSGTTADISTLGQGSYIYRATCGGKQLTGKFLKK